MATRRATPAPRDLSRTVLPDARMALAEEVILLSLIDGYERSAAFGHPGPWRKDVILPFTAREFPEAFAPNGYEAREATADAAAALAARGAIRIEPIKGQSPRHPKQFRLGPGELAAAYLAAQRFGHDPLEATLDRVGTHCEALLRDALPSWATSFLADAATKVRAGSLEVFGIANRPLLRKQASAWTDALTAFSAIARGVHAYERLFSEQVFGDSKRFARVRDRTADLLRRADPQWASATDDDAPSDTVLAGYDLKRRPLVIQCAGDLTLSVGQARYRLGDFAPMAVLPVAWAPMLARGLREASSVHGHVTVTTIENEYSFFAYVDEAGGPDGLAARREVVVYTAGFPAPPLTDLLREAARDNPSLVVRHWGDADVGGILIWWMLRSRVGCPVAWFRTSAEWVQDQATLRAGRALDASDRRRLIGTVEMLRSLRGSGSPMSDVDQALALADALLVTGQKFEQERFV